VELERSFERAASGKLAIKRKPLRKIKRESSPSFPFVSLESRLNVSLTHGMDINCNSDQKSMLVIQSN
jgi:hypothetical protein